MNRFVFTENATDLWLKSVKELDYIPLVFNKELDGVLLPWLKTVDHPEADLFNSILPYAENHPGVYVFGNQPELAVWEENTLNAFSASELDLSRLVFPLSSIAARVRIAKYLEKGVVSSHFISGTFNSWRWFAQYYNSLIETGVVERFVPSRNLALNLFAIYFPSKIRILSLQSAKEE